MFRYLNNKNRYFSYSYKIILIGGKKHATHLFHQIKWSKRIRRLGKNTPRKTILPLLKTFSYMTNIGRSKCFDLKYSTTRFGSGVKGYYSKCKYDFINDFNCIELQNSEIFYFFDSVIHNSFFIDKEAKSNYKYPSYSMFNTDIFDLEEKDEFCTKALLVLEPEHINFLEDYLQVSVGLDSKISFITFNTFIKKFDKKKIIKKLV